jgi:hypothetical protein
MNEEVFAIGPMKRLTASEKTRSAMEYIPRLTSRGI